MMLIFQECSANLIAENILVSVHSDVFYVTMLQAITDYNKDDAAIDIANKHVITSKGRRRSRIKTKGWNLKVTWRNDAEY